MAKKEVYHHGDLRRALILAALEELEASGPEKFSLRGCAKRAGVSHAAPAHHFKDTQTLLQAVAASGFEQLIEAMEAEQQTASNDVSAQLVAAGIGYVQFASNNKPLFGLMFSGYTLDLIDPDLGKQSDAAFSVFVNAVRKIRGQSAFQTQDGWRDVTAIWSMVHGYAQLAASEKMGYATQLSMDEQRSYIGDMLRRVIA